MKFKYAIVALALVFAAGCDTMDRDADGQMLSINNEPAYLFGDGIIDLQSRIVSPGKIKVEITGSTRNGSLQDIGKGLLHYSRTSNSTHDSFRFRVLSADDRLLREDSIGIIIPTDTTSLPCKYVYAKSDTAWNVTGPITVNVAANDYSCSDSLRIAISTQPAFGTATVVGNQIHYIPQAGFAGTDFLLYKATSSNPSVVAGYAFLRIYGTNADCTPTAVDDLFYKPLNDTSAMPLDVLANDILCDSVPNVVIGVNPNHGYAWYDNTSKKIFYRNLPASNNPDTLRYNLCSAVECTAATVVIKRN